MHDQGDHRPDDGPDTRRAPRARLGFLQRHRAKVLGYAYSMACTPYDSGTLAPAYSERITTDAENDEERARMFDPELPMPTGSGCPD